MAQARLYTMGEDVEWLFDTAMRDFPELRERTRSFVLEGNEDCPKSVELYEYKFPRVTDKPFIVHKF